MTTKAKDFIYLKNMKSNKEFKNKLEYLINYTNKLKLKCDSTDPIIKDIIISIDSYSEYLLNNVHNFYSFRIPESIKEEIIKHRFIFNESYGFIAKRYNISKTSVFNICKKHKK